MYVCLRQLTYHLMVTIDKEEVFRELEDGQDATISPHLVLLVDKHNVVWFDISLQDTNVPEGVHQPLQGPNKKGQVWNLAFHLLLV